MSHTAERITETSLLRFAGEGRVVEFSVPWASKTLFLVPGPPFVGPLMASGVARGRIWTVAEVLDVLLTGVSVEDARKIAGTKLLYDGAVAAAEKYAGPARPARRPAGAQQGRPGMPRQMGLALS